MKWISVDKELPKPLKEVLVVIVDSFDKSRRVTIAIYVPEKYITDEDFNLDDCTGDLTEYDEEQDCFWVKESWYETRVNHEYDLVEVSMDYVAHWMELPELPKE